MLSPHCRNLDSAPLVAQSDPATESAFDEISHMMSHVSSALKKQEHTRIRLGGSQHLGHKGVSFGDQFQGDLWLLQTIVHMDRKLSNPEYCTGLG